MEGVDASVIGTTVVLVLLGLAVAAGGLRLFVKAKAQARRCTAQVDGEIVDIVNGRRQRGRTARGSEEEVVAANEAIAAKKRAYAAAKRREREEREAASLATWRPIVRYTVGETAFTVRAVRAVPRDRFKVGQLTAVHYDPADPSRQWFELDGLPKALGGLLMICGAAIAVVGVLCWFVLPALNQMGS